MLLIRWQVKFSGLLTDDPDYQRAKRSRNIALILWLLAIPLGFLVGPFLSFFLSRLF